MPSFDVVSEIDMHELTNAVDQANREISTRFDFKGSGASYELEKEAINLVAQSDFQVKQMQDILNTKVAKRGIDLKCLAYDDIQTRLHEARQTAKVRQGIDADMAKKIIRAIKDSKLKVQAAIQGDQVRVTGKKRDDLQDVISLLKKEDFGLPLQYVNFRD